MSIALPSDEAAALMTLGAPVPMTTGAVDSLASPGGVPASDASLDVVPIGLASVGAASFPGAAASLAASSGTLAASSALASEPDGEGDDESLEKQPPAAPTSVAARHAREANEGEHSLDSDA
jgi:hypothetical protein